MRHPARLTLRIGCDVVAETERRWQALVGLAGNRVVVRLRETLLADTDIIRCALAGIGHRFERLPATLLLSGRGLFGGLARLVRLRRGCEAAREAQRDTQNERRSKTAHENPQRKTYASLSRENPKGQ